MRGVQITSSVAAGGMLTSGSVLGVLVIVIVMRVLAPRLLAAEGESARAVGRVGLLVEGSLVLEEAAGVAGAGVGSGSSIRSGSSSPPGTGSSVPTQKRSRGSGVLWEGVSEVVGGIREAWEKGAASLGGNVW